MTKVNQDKLKELFTYHVPTSKQRQTEHEIINKASEEFAVALSKVIDNPAELITLLRKIQEMRMLVNQAITFKYNNLSYRDIFVEKEK